MYFGDENDNNHLFLERLIDEPNDALTIVVAHSKSVEPLKADLNGLFHGKSRIVPNYNRLYRIYFDHYIFYQVRNESYSIFNPKEISKGNSLRFFVKSELLVHLDSIINMPLVVDNM